MLQLTFPDKCVSYETFINDLSCALLPKLVDALSHPGGIVSQNEDYRLFGKCNVNRWVRQQRLVPVAKRPGKIEYRYTDLQLCQQRVQDYL